MCRQLKRGSHQELWTSLLQLVQLFVQFRQPPVDFVQVRLQVLVLLMVSVKLPFVVVALLLVFYWRIFTKKKKKEPEGRRRQ